MEYKVRVIKDFNDLQDGIKRKVNDEFECNEERYKVLTGKNKNKKVVVELIEKIEDEPTKEETKKIVKKTITKKTIKKK